MSFCLEPYRPHSPGRSSIRDESPPQAQLIQILMERLGSSDMDLDVPVFGWNRGRLLDGDGVCVFLARWGTKRGEKDLVRESRRSIRPEAGAVMLVKKKHKKGPV